MRQESEKQETIIVNLGLFPSSFLWISETADVVRDRPGNFLFLFGTKLLLRKFTAQGQNTLDYLSVLNPVTNDPT